MSVAELLALVPSYHASQPKFMAMLEMVLAPFVAAANVARDLPAHFDIDDAIGVQLDVVGEWVGRSRNVPVPLPGIYFSLDDALRGLDQGVWKGPFDTAVGITALPDDVYRRLLYANILAKRWDGTVPGAQAAFDAFFTGAETRVFVQDNAQVPFPRAVFALDMAGQGLDEGFWDEGQAVASIGAVDVSMTIGVAGKIPEPVILSLLGIGAIPIKPAGVTTTYSVVSVDETALFGLDVQNEYVAGLDTGSWGVSPDTLLNA